MEKKNSNGNKPIPLFKNAPQRIETLSSDEIRLRRKKKAQKKRKLKRLFMSFVLVLVLCAVGVALSLTVFFKIETVTVTGAELYSEEQVIASCGLAAGDNLLLADEKIVENKLTYELPFIGSVSIEKKLPSEIIINVTETREIAAISSDGGYVLLAPDGKIVDDNAGDLRENVALIEGVSLKSKNVGFAAECTDENKTGALKAVLKALDESGIDGISSVDLNDTNNITMKYDFRIKLLTGNAGNMVKKLQKAKLVLEKENAVNDRQYGTLDLRSEPNSYFRPGSDETEPVTEINKAEDETEAENGAEITEENTEEG